MPVANARIRDGTPYKPPTCIARLTIGILLPAGAVRASKRDSTDPLYWSMTTQLRPGTVESSGNFICTTHEPVFPLGGMIRARLAPGSWGFEVATASSILIVDSRAGGLEGTSRVSTGELVAWSKNGWSLSPYAFNKPVMQSTQIKALETNPTVW